MTAIPAFATIGNDDKSVLARMKTALLATLALQGRTIDTSEGSLPHDAMAPASIEVALAASFAEQVIQRVYIHADGAILGPYLDLALQDRGMSRLGATKAHATLTFGGTNGTIIPVGSEFSSQSTSQKASQTFVTDADVTISGGVASVGATALVAGADGNVAAGSVNIIVTNITGLTSVTNLVDASGGTDQESDPNALARFDKFVQSPTGGGRPADYDNWSLEVVGVGGSSAVLERDGPGTVPIALIGTDKLPATQAIIDAVLDHILYPWRLLYEAEALTVSLSSGVSVDATQTDDVGNSMLMAYSAVAVGRIIQNRPPLPEAGIWTLRVRAKVNSAAGANNLLEMGVWNVDAAAWTKSTPTGSVDGVRTLKPNQMSTLFAWYEQDFYWNGRDQIETRLTRLQTDTTTSLWLDEVYYRSVFQADDGSGNGLSPVGARVSTEAAVAVPINVAATITVLSGYDRTTVLAALTVNVTSFIQGLAFARDNDIHYVKVGGLILDTPGVNVYSSLLLNGGSADIVIGPQQVATVGTVVWS